MLTQLARRIGESEAIKALSKEMCPAILLQKVAWHHLDAGLFRHQVVRVFDPPEALGIS